MGAYSQSKLANILFTAELARRLHDTGVTCVSLHPGFVATEFLRNHGSVTCGQSCLRSCLKCFACCFAKRSDDGAATSIYCACDPSIPEKNGLYFEYIILTYPLLVTAMWLVLNTMLNSEIKIKTKTFFLVILYISVKN